jgi:hypothetical protein
MRVDTAFIADIHPKTEKATFISECYLIYAGTDRSLPRAKPRGSHTLSRAVQSARLDILATILPMPTVLRSGPYRFYFYSHEPNEPPHIHVDRDDSSAKFWLDPVQLAANFGFRAHELRTLQLMVIEHQTRFLEAWDEFFGSSGR